MPFPDSSAVYTQIVERNWLKYLYIFKSANQQSHCTAMIDSYIAEGLWWDLVLKKGE
jgi:hypothetical protein